jgi:hypothetical protein
VHERGGVTSSGVAVVPVVVGVITVADLTCAYGNGGCSGSTAALAVDLAVKRIIFGFLGCFVTLSAE